MSSRRQNIEKRSAVLLVFLHGLPRWLPPLILAALLVAGLALQNPIPLILVGLVLAWLAYLSWPALSQQSRMLRVAGIGVLALIAIIQIVRF